MSLKLKVGREHVDYLQQYETLAVILSQALGGGGKGGTEYDRTANEPKTAAEAHRMFKALFSK